MTSFLPLPSGRKGKRESLRARRRRTRIIVVTCCLVATVLIAVGISYASYQPTLTVQGTSVQGATHVDPEEIQDYVFEQLHDQSWHFISHSNIFAYHPKQLAQQLVAHFPRIKSAQVGRASPFATVLDIRIEERQPFALWCVKRKHAVMTEASTTEAVAVPDLCYEIDDTGFIFAPSEVSEPSGRSYIFTGGVSATSTEQNENPVGQQFAPSHLSGILALLTFLKDDGFAPVGATVVDDQDFSIPLKESFYIKASFGESAVDVVKNLQLVLSAESLKDQQEKIEYIDLRFGNRVYFKLKGQEQELGT